MAGVSRRCASKEEEKFLMKADEEAESSMASITVFVFAASLVAHAQGMIVPAVRTPLPAVRAPVVPVAVAEAPPVIGVRPRLRRALSSLWSLCNEEVCTTRSIRPVQFLRRLVPKRRPLSKLGRSLSCADPGTYKIHRTEGSRMWMYKPAEDVKEECNLDDAMDMF